MWPRVAEIVLGCWLVVSPWLLPDQQRSASWHVNALVCGLLVVGLAALSFFPSLRKAHLAEILIGLWLLGSAYWSATHPAPPLVQSNILTALFLLNFAIIPSQATLPAPAWRDASPDNPPQLSATSRSR